MVCVLLIGLAALPLVGARGLVVTSGSMEPTIAVGALAVVTPVDTDDVRPGHVLTYNGYGADRLTTHRVIDLVPLDSGLHFQTQGDANEAPDPNLAPAHGVIGRVALTIPHAGRALTLMMQRWVLLGLVALTALPPLLSELRSLYQRVTSRHRPRRRVPHLVMCLTIAIIASGIAASHALMTGTALASDNTITTSDNFTTP